MKGMGLDLDISVKYEMPIPIMGCKYCLKPNLFECYRIHGRITSKCLIEAQKLIEAYK